MNFSQVTLNTGRTATGLVVVIDVLRAFTTAAYAFAAGAKEILLVSTVEEAFALRDKNPNALIMGEVNGLPVKGFDFGNSPTEIARQNLQGKQLIQRSSAGTQGVVRSTQADTLLAASFVCADATVKLVRQLAPTGVTFVITGATDGRNGDEDAACADYLTACLRGHHPNPAPFLERIPHSTSGRLFVESGHPLFPKSDLERCAEVDRFNFAMQVNRRNGLLILEKKSA